MSGYHMSRDERPAPPPKLVELLPPRPTGERSIRIAEIKREVAKKFNVSVSDLEGPGRHNKVAIPRHVAFWICRNGTRHSYPKIGREFGLRNHATVIGGVHNIDAALTLDAELWDDVMDILARLDRSATSEEERGQ